MIVTKLHQGLGEPREDIRRVIDAINLAERLDGLPAVTRAEPIAAGAGTLAFGGLAFDRATFRRLIPDFRWLVYAAGAASSGDANPLTLGLQYLKDNAGTVPLGSTTVTGAAVQKFTLGPFDLFVTAGVPVENVVVVQLGATKAAGAAGSVVIADVWLRLLPRTR